MSSDQTISLYELNRMVKLSLQEGLPQQLWIRAETSDVRVNQNGHCYLEFIEKDGTGKGIIAKARAAIWSNIFVMLRTYFESATGQPFTSGLKVMVQVSVEFHEVYGLNLNVQDIDPAYTLGDQALNRAAIIRQLEEEGVLGLNKELELPALTNRIAIISSPTAAGYEDFCNQLYNNSQGFAFYTKLFPAIMQGDRTEDSIIAALERIYDNIDSFDTVIIIRGGGATSELSCFDSYLLAASIAQFPLPVITGIGHERDETVLDIVAHTRAKTPTAVAEFLISHMQETASDLEQIQDYISDTVNDRIQSENDSLAQIDSYFFHLARSWHKDQLNILQSAGILLRKEIQIRRKECDSKLSNLEHKLIRESKQCVKEQTNNLSNHTENLKKNAKIQSNQIDKLYNISELLKKTSLNILTNKREKMDVLSKLVELASPTNILKKGYTLTMLDGKLLKSVEGLEKGNLITTHFVDGEITSEVK